MSGRLLRLAYQFAIHRWGEWTAHRWGVTIPLAGALVLLLGWLLRGRPRVGAAWWVVISLLVAIAFILIVLHWWGYRHSFVAFAPQLGAVAPAGLALDPTDKVRLHATGTFEVEGKVHFFAQLLAYWRTFTSREHAVMAIVHASRFLKLAHMPEEHLGMWYIFFRPEDIRAVVPGLLSFGTQTFPALRVSYLNSSSSSDKGQRRGPKQVLATVYLAFEDEESRQRVWADLLADS